MKARSILCLFGIALALVVGCKEEAPKPAPNTGAAGERKDASSPFTATNDVAVIKTSAGDIVAEFWPEVAPGTVENYLFAKLESTPCGPGNAGEMSRPTQRVGLESIRILPGNQVK